MDIIETITVRLYILGVLNKVKWDVHICPLVTSEIAFKSVAGFFFNVLNVWRPIADVGNCNFLHIYL